MNAKAEKKNAKTVNVSTSVDLIGVNAILAIIWAQLARAAYVNYLLFINVQVGVVVLKRSFTNTEK